MQHSTTIGILALALAAGTASAQWSDNLDSYPVGPLNSGGWDGWDGSPSAYGTVTTDQARSAPNSIAVGPASDAVRLFSGMTSGQWTLTCQVYVPGDLDGTTFFIMNNEYNHGGPYDWAVEIDMDPITGLANDELRDPDGLNATPLLVDQWVEIAVTFDLDNNTMTNSYNGVEIGSGNDWNFWFGGAVELQAIDLFAPHNGTVYYDDFVLAPAGGDPCLDGFANCNGDGAVNTQDFLCYLGLWSAGNLAADCNGDNTVNTQDFLCYLGLWSACQ